MSNNQQIMHKNRNENSFFVRFHENSTLSSEIFCADAKYREKRVQVLQIMKLDSGYLIVECVYLNRN